VWMFEKVEGDKYLEYLAFVLVLQGVVFYAGDLGGIEAIAFGLGEELVFLLTRVLVPEFATCLAAVDGFGRVTGLD